MYFASEVTSFFKLFPQLSCYRASLVAQRLKSLPAMQETWVRSLGREDPLEKEMATHSSILAWRIPWTEEPGGLQSTGWQRVGTTEGLHLLQNIQSSLCYRVGPWCLSILNITVCNMSVPNSLTIPSPLPLPIPPSRSCFVL